MIAETVEQDSRGSSPATAVPSRTNMDTNHRQSVLASIGEHFARSQTQITSTVPAERGNILEWTFGSTAAPQGTERSNAHRMKVRRQELLKFEAGLSSDPQVRLTHYVQRSIPFGQILLPDRREGAVESRPRWTRWGSGQRRIRALTCRVVWLYDVLTRVPKAFMRGWPGHNSRLHQQCCRQGLRHVRNRQGASVGVR